MREDVRRTACVIVKHDNRRRGLDENAERLPQAVGPNNLAFGGSIAVTAAR